LFSKPDVVIKKFTSVSRKAAHFKVPITSGRNFRLDFSLLWTMVLCDLLSFPFIFIITIIIIVVTSDNAGLLKRKVLDGTEG
jgi:hypothetical protein